MFPTPGESEEKTLKQKILSILSNKYAVVAVALVAVIGVGGLVLADQRTTAVPGGMWLSIDQINALPTTGAAWTNVKTQADGSLGAADIADQTSNHDIKTLAAALVYARTGDEAYRSKAAAAVMSAIGSEDGGRTLALSWNLSAYVISADLINLPQYDAAKNTQFKNWLTGVRTETLDSKSLISTHEDRPNNWGTSAGASRVAADIYIGDKTDLAKAANVFKGYLGDRAAYAGFSYGDLSWQCDPSKPVGINPAGCKISGTDQGGAIPDDMRRGASFKVPPVATDYPWTALQGVTVQAELLSRQGYDSYGWSNQAVKRSIEYMYNLSRTAGSGWWANLDEAWVPWVINSHYGSNYPTTSNSATGRVTNFTDWTHAKPGQQVPPTKDTTAPTAPTNLAAPRTVEKHVELTWGPSTDNVTVTSYQVTRNGTSLGYTSSTTFTDTSAVVGQTYTYQVKAYDAAGNTSSAISKSVTVTSAQGDTTVPVTAITKPTNGASITAETTPITFTATDNLAVTKIEFYVDTQLEGTVTDIAGRTSFSANWNTKASGNGKHVLQVKAYDAAGNVGKSAEVTTTVTLPTTPTNPGTPTGDGTNFVAVADSRVNEDNPTNNYGTEDFLRIRNDSKDWRTYLRFDVSGLSAAPKSVKLRIFANDGGPDAGTAYFVNNAWGESTITWNNAPVIAQSFLIGKSTTGSVNDQSWVEYDLTGKLKANGSYSIGLKSDNDNSIYFSSREGKNKPVIVIVK